MTMTRSKLMSVMAAALSVVFATHAAAVDGEILINQAKANAGGVTPGDAAGFPATLSKPGRYKLSGNLRVPAGVPGIEVTADDVTVDLNGFTIASAQPGQAQSGVVAPSGVNGLRVLNGTITGFQNYGVYNCCARAVVENMRIIDSATGVYAPSGRISNNTIVGGSSTGIKCQIQCLIENNIITAHGAGIEVFVEGVAIIGNVLVGNGVQGIGAFDTTGYGENILVGNNGGFGQVSGGVVQMHPNACNPACP